MDSCPISLEHKKNGGIQDFDSISSAEPLCKLGLQSPHWGSTPRQSSDQRRDLQAAGKAYTSISVSLLVTQ